MWDPALYARFSGERERPFFDLLARVTGTPGRIADLGCGTAELTRTLLDRWPQARVTGVDSSATMLARARERSREHSQVDDPRLELVEADAAAWRSAAPLDLLVSNAMLQWLPDHDAAIRHFAEQLAPGGTLAVQMPANFAAPSHTILREVAGTGPWAELLAGTLRHEAVQPLSGYVHTLQDLGLVVDAWETTYLHVLSGRDPVLEWLTGTALRPVLARLEGALRDGFLAALGGRLREAYPPGAHGTLFPFRRLFWVARKPG